MWEGEGAEAAQQRTFADLIKVRGLSDHLYEAAKIARRGADQGQVQGRGVRVRFLA